MDILLYNRYLNSTMNNPALEQFAIDPVSLGLGAVAGIVLGYLFSLGKTIRLEREKAALSAKLEAERAGLGDHFATLAQAALKSNTESFLALAQEKLKSAQKDGAHDLEKRSIAIEKLVKPVEQHLHRMSGMVAQLEGTAKATSEQLQNLHKETSKLTSTLRNPSAQGKWGEFVLEAILEKAHLKRGTHYETQTAIEGGGRPDVIINLHDGFRIAIDSKAPINDHISRLDEDLSEDELKAIKANMARAVRGHVKVLGARSYQENIAGSDFVILFLPSEVVFSATLQNDPSIVDYASDNNVVIASPTLIISLLRVVGLSWRQVEMAKNAAEVSALAIDLHKRFTTFLDHFQKIGKGLGGAVQSYEKALGSMNRMVLPAARKFEKLHSGKQAANLGDLPSLEAPQALLSADDFDDDESNKASHG